MKPDKATVFDKIGASTPLNRTAGAVTGEGEQAWKSEKAMPPGFLHWDAPPRMVEPGTGETDLRGKKFGRFTVVGALAPGIVKGRRWVCRCVCGDYEARTTQTISMALAGLVDLNQIGYRCWNCGQLQATQNQYAKKGSRPLSDFVDAKARVLELEQRTPETIIATLLEKITGKEDRAYENAVMIVGKINSAGYRIVRDKNTIDPNALDPAPVLLNTSTSGEV